MKKLIPLFVFVLSFTMYSQNFSINGKFLPEVESTIEICYISDDKIE